MRPTKHKLKILPEYFDLVINGVKKFEIRKNDKNFREDDIVVLQEYDYDHYTGRETTIKIKYVLKDVPEYGLMKDYCIFNW